MNSLPSTEQGSDSVEFLQTKRLIESLVSDKISLQRQLLQSEAVRERAIRLLSRYEQVVVSKSPNGLTYHFSDGNEATELSQLTRSTLSSPRSSLTTSADLNSQALAEPQSTHAASASTYSGEKSRDPCETSIDQQSTKNSTSSKSSTFTPVSTTYPSAEESRAPGKALNGGLTPINRNNFSSPFTSTAKPNTGDYGPTSSKSTTPAAVTNKSGSIYVKPERGKNGTIATNGAVVSPSSASTGAEKAQKSPSKKPTNLISQKLGERAKATSNSPNANKENIKPQGSTQNQVSAQTIFSSPQTSITSKPSQKRLTEGHSPDPKRNKPAEPKTFPEYDAVLKCLSILHSSDYGSRKFNPTLSFKPVENLKDLVYYHFCLRNRVIIAAKNDDISKTGLIQYHCHTCAKIIFQALFYSDRGYITNFLDETHQCSVTDIRSQLTRLWKSDKDAEQKMKFFNSFYQEFGLPKTKNLIYQYGLRKKSSFEITKQTSSFLETNKDLCEELVRQTNYTNDELVRLLSLYILRITDKDVNDEILREKVASQNLTFIYNTK